MRLRYKLTIAFTAVVIVPMIALVLINERMMGLSISASYESEAKNEAERIVTYSFRKMFESVTHYVGFLANDMTVVHAAYYAKHIDGPEDLQAVLNEAQARLGLSYLEVSNNDGIVTASTLAERVGVALHPGNGHVDTATELSSVAGKLTLRSLKRITRDDELIGMLHGGYFLDRTTLRDMAGDTILGLHHPGSEMTVATQDVPIDTERTHALFDSVTQACAHAPSSAACTGPRYDIWTAEAGNASYLFAAVPIRLATSAPVATLIVARQSTAMQSDLRDSRNTIIVLGLIFSVVASLLGFAVSRKIAEPIDRERTDLQALADTDQLTGLMNRRSMQRVMSAELSRVKREQRILGVAMLDIDRFKAINDTHGHKTGDIVLKHVAAVCASTLRMSDYCFRYGGEEFVLLLGTLISDSNAPAAPQSRDNALVALERLRRAIENTPVFCDGNIIRITASFGVALSPNDGDTADVILQHADQALYAAKQGGRNRVCIYGEHQAAAKEHGNRA